MVDSSIAKEKVLYEVERWFRAKLRGETILSSHDVALFRALAELRNAREDLYVSKDGETLRPSCRASELEKLPTTRPPPPDSHEELLRISRREQDLAANAGLPKARKPSRSRRSRSR